MAVLTAALISRAGVDIAGAAADVAGDEFANTGREVAFIKNGSGSPITVTLDIQTTVDGQAVTDPTVTVAAGVTKAFGPYSAAYEDGNRHVHIAYSAVTSVTVKVLKFPEA